MSSKQYYNLPDRPALAFSNQSTSVSFYLVCDQPNASLYSKNYWLTVSAKSHANGGNFTLNLSPSEITHTVRVLGRFIANKAVHTQTTPAVRLATRKGSSLAFQASQINNTVKPTLYFNNSGKDFFLPLSIDEIRLIRLKALDALKTLFPEIGIAELTKELDLDPPSQASN